MNTAKQNNDKYPTNETINRIVRERKARRSNTVSTISGDVTNVIGNPDIRLKGGERALEMSPEALEKTMAKNQSGEELLGLAWKGFAYNLASSFVSHFGSFEPELAYNMMLGQEQNYSNTLLDLAHGLQQKGQSTLNRMYRKNPGQVIDFTDPAYWAEQHVQAGTSFGMFAASALETLAITALTRGRGTAPAIAKNAATITKAMTNMKKAKKYQTFLSQTVNHLKRMPTQALVFGAINRHAESVMEAGETFRQLQDEFIYEGYDKETATKYAAEGAARVYRLNMPLFLLDAVQWTLLTRLSPFKGSQTMIDAVLDKIKNPFLKAATTLGLNMISEGAEEGYQHIAQEEGSLFARRRHAEDFGLEADNSTFGNRLNNYVQDAHFWNAVVAGAYGSLLLAPIGGAGGYINQKMLESSQKEFNEKMLWANQQKQLELLSKSYDLEQSGRLEEALLLRQQATNAEALNALEWDAVTGKKSSWTAFENKYQELINLSKQDDATIDEALINMGFTDENGFNIESRKDLVKGKEGHFEKALADGRLAKEIFESTVEELGVYGKRGLIAEVTARKLQAAQISEQIENLEEEVKSFTGNMESLTSIGKLQFEVEASKKARQENLEKLKKSVEEGKLEGKDKTLAEKKIEEIESSLTEEIQQAILNNHIEANNLSDNRTSVQKTEDAKAIKKILSEHKNNPVAKQEFFKERLAELEDIIAKSTSEIALKTNYRQHAIEAINLAENIEELKEVGEQLVEDKQMEVALKNAIDNKVIKLNSEKLESREDVTIGDVLEKRHEKHIEIAENEVIANKANEIAVQVEKSLPKETEFDEWEALFGDVDAPVNLSQKHSTLVNDYVSFSEKHSFLNTEQVEGIAEVLRGLVKMGLLPKDFTIEQASEKLIPFMGITGEMATPYIIGIAKAMESMEIKINRPNVAKHIEKMATPPTQEVTDEVVNEQQNEEKTEVESVTEVGEKNIHYKAQPTFSYLSKRYELVQETVDGVLVERIVEIVDELNQSQIVDYKHLLDPNINLYEEDFVLFIPENFQDLPVAIKTETGSNVKGQTKPFKEFNFQEGSQEWVDNIPIFVGMRNPQTGEVTPVAYVHQQGWVTKENLFLEKFESNTVQEKYDEVDKVNITKQAQEQNRMVRQTVVDNKGLSVDIKVNDVSTGKILLLDKNKPLKPLKDASLNQAIPIMIDKGNIIGLPDGIDKSQIAGLTAFLGEFGTKAVIAEIRLSETTEYGDKIYNIYKVSPGKFQPNTSLVFDMKQSISNAVKIYLYRDYILGNKKVPRGDGALAHEVKQLKKLHEQLLNSENWYELTEQLHLYSYLENFFIQTSNFGLSSKVDLKESIDTIFKNAKNGVPFIKVTTQGGVVMGAVGQDAPYITFSPENIDVDLLETELSNFMSTIDNSLQQPETSPIIPKNTHLYEKDATLSFLVTDENGDLIVKNYEGGYREFLYENAMYTNVLTENLGTQEKPVYVTRFQKSVRFEIKEEQKKSKVIQDSKYINEQIIKEQEKLVENLPETKEETKKEEVSEETLPEQLISEEELQAIKEENDLLQIAKQFTKFLIEQPAKDTDSLMTMRGYLEVIPIEYQLKIIDYIYNQMVSQIDLQNIQQTNLANLKKSIKEIVYNEILAHEKAHAKILSSLEAIENPSEIVKTTIQDLKRFQEYFDVMKNPDGYAKLEKQAIEEFKKRTNITESSNEGIDSDGNVIEDTLEENNRQSESLLEQSSLTKVWKPTQEANIFLHGIPVLDNNGNFVRTIFGLPEYHDPKEMLERVRALSTLYLTDPTIEGFIDNLETILTNNPDYYWLKSFLDRFKTTDKKTQTVLVTNLVKDVVIMEFVSFNFNHKTKEWSSSVWNTNANDIARLVQNSWESQIFISDVVDFNGEVAIYNKENIKNIIANIRNLKNNVENKTKSIVEATPEQNKVLEQVLKRKGLNMVTLPTAIRGVSLDNLLSLGSIITFESKTYRVSTVKGRKISLELTEKKETGSILGDIQEIFKAMGVDLKNTTVHHLIQNGITNTKGVTTNLQGLFARNGLFFELEKSLSAIANSKEDVEVDVDNSTFPLNNSSFSNLAKLEAKYNLSKLSQSFRDNKKTISTYKDTTLFTQKTIGFKSANNSQRALYKKNPFSKHSLWLSLLDGQQNENNLMREFFMSSYLGLTSLKEIGKRNYRDNSLHKLDDSDLEFIYLSAFTDLKAGKLTEGHTVKGFETRLARMFSFPMADKDLIFMTKTIVLDIKAASLKNDFSNSLQEMLYSQLALPEIERMLNHVKHDENTNIEGYNDGAMLAIMYPAINGTIIEHNGQKYTLQNFVRVFAKELENPRSSESIVLKNSVLPKIVETIKSKIQNKIKVWEESGIIYTHTEENKEPELRTKIDSKYLKSLGEDLSLEQKIYLTAANFTINQHIASANQAMLFFGDIAQFTKLDDNARESLKALENVELTEQERIQHSEVISKSIDDNFGKRAAMMLAPRSHTEDSVNSTYIQIFLADHVGISNIMPYITEKLDGVAITTEELVQYEKALSLKDKKTAKKILDKFPNSKGYFKINATDAQEYTTVREHLYNLEKRGELGNLTTEDVLEKTDEIMEQLHKGVAIENLSSEHKKLMDFVLQPMKNVYTGEIWDEQNNMIRSMYIKSSDFPLMPWLTFGTPLDSLRLAMEQVEKQTGLNVRASYESANKVGGLTNKFNMFNSNGDIVTDLVTPENLLKSSLVLERKYHGKQQNVPFKSDKKSYDDVSLGTQESKILMSLVSDLEGFEYKGEKISGQRLIEEYNQTFAEIYDLQYQELFNSLGINPITGKVDKPIKHLKALQKLVAEEANNRGWSLKDKESLTVVAKIGLQTTEGDRVVLSLSLKDVENLQSGKYDLSSYPASIKKLLSKKNLNELLGAVSINFEIPAWISGNKQNIESLLNSIVSKRVSQIRMPGSSYVLGSSAGFTFTSMDALSEAQQVSVAQGTIYFDNYEGGELKNSHIDENGVFHAAQVLLPSKIRDNKGKLLNLNDPKYYEIKNGRKYIKKEMFSQEIWERISFRIPTSKLSSLSAIEVVGLLPHSVGDLIITPKDFTVQKGLDFDVDKEYTYHKYTWIDENGVVHPLKAKYENKDVTKISKKELLKTERDYIKLLSIVEEQEELQGIYNYLADLNDTRSAEAWGINDRQDELWEVLDSFEAEYGTYSGSTELLQVIKDRIEYQKDLPKLLKNDLIDQHLAVLKHPELQKEILEVLSIELAKKDADYFQNLSGDKSTDYFTMLDATYQISKISNAASSRVGVGAYSLDVVFNGLLQQAHKKTGEDIYLREIFINEEGYPIWIPYELNIGGLKTSGSIVQDKTLDGQRSKAEVMSERQNLMLDDAKEGVAWRVNLNTITMDADKALIFLGYDLLDGHSIAFSLFSQPIIKDFVKVMKRLGAATQNDFVTDKINSALEIVVEKYGGLESFKETPYKEIIASVKHEDFKQGIENTDNLKQLAFLHLFLDLDAKGKNIRKVETSLNVDSKGVGISINEVLERKETLLKILEREKAIAGVSSLFGKVKLVSTSEQSTIQQSKEDGFYSVGQTLIKEEFYEVLVKPETAPAIATVNGLKAVELLWLPHFAQSHVAYQKFRNAVLSEIQQNIKEEEETFFNVALEEDLLEAYQKFHNTDFETGLFEGEVDEIRRIFIRDGVNTNSLGTYLMKLKIGEQKELFEKNAFLKSLRFRIDKQGKTLIEFNGSARINVDEKVVREAIAILYNSAQTLPPYNGREYSTRELIKDLRTFAYLQGGIQEAVEFVNYLPIELLSKTNYIAHVNKLNTLLKGNLRMDFNDVFKTEALTKQFFQHFPHRAQKITIKEIEENEANVVIDRETGAITTKTIDKKNLTEFEFTSGPTFLTLYDRDSETNYALFMYNPSTAKYEKIPTYTSFGMSQYNKQRPVEKNVESVSVVNELESLILKVRNGKKGYVKNLNHVVLKGKDTEIPLKILKSSVDESVNFFGLENKSVNVLNASSILNKIAESENLSQFERDLGSLLSKALSKTPIEIVLFEDTVDFDGFYVKQTPNFLTGLVGFNEAIFNYSEQEQARIILHEFIHATLKSEIGKFLDAKGNWLSKTPPSNPVQTAIYQIGKLYQQYNNQAKNDTTLSKKRFVDSSTLALENVHEFISEILTSKSFQKELSERIVPKTEKSFLQKFTELVNKFLNALNKSLGYEVKKDSITVEAISNILFVLESGLQNKQKQNTVSSQVQQIQKNAEQKSGDTVSNENQTTDEYSNIKDYYEGDIKPEPNTVFVFGSNPEGRHGAGAAKIARDKFGAIYGQGEGLQGNAYALPTKDLRIKENRGLKSISPKQITDNIIKLYDVAEQNPDKQFKIAFRNTTETSLNGYTGLEMIEMFNDAAQIGIGYIPSNIVFSKEWVDTNKIKSNFAYGKKTRGKSAVTEMKAADSLGFMLDLESQDNYYDANVNLPFNDNIELKLSKKHTVKEGVSELFNENPELTNEMYSKLLTNPDISAENLLSLLEKENIVEKDCSGGKLKAKDGIRSKFTKGSQWEIVKDLKDYPSHAQGGVDIKLGKNGFSFTRDNGVIEAKYGLVLPKIK